MNARISIDASLFRLVLMQAVVALLLVGCASREGVAYRGIPKNVQEFEVDGLKVILRPTGPTHHTIVAKLFIKGGLPALPGDVSPAVEQLALQVPALSGPTWISREQYWRELNRMGSGFPVSVDKDFSIVTLTSVDENFDRTWELFAGVLTSPRFDDVELANMKERLTIAIKNRTIVPESYAEFLADSVFFAGHPYGRYVQLEDVPRINEATLRKYMSSLLVKSRMFLVVVGNVSKDEIEKKVKESLAKLPQGDFVMPEVETPPSASRTTLLIRPPEGRMIPTNYIVARHLAPHRNDPLFYAMRRLTSFVSGSLFREVRMEHNLSYAPGASAQYYSVPFGDVAISTVYPDSAWAIAKDSVIEFFRDYILREEVVTGNNATWITSQYMDEQTAENQAYEIGTAEFYTGTWRNAFATFEALKSITAQQLNDAARKYMTNFTIVIVGNPDAITRTVYLPRGAGDDAGT